MPDSKPLKAFSDVIYAYDGSFPGFLCCVFESVYQKELPVDILPEEDLAPTFFQVKHIETDQAKAERVRASIPKKISKRALELVMAAFCGCLAQQKELCILKFLLRGYREGGMLCEKLGDPVVAPLLQAERHLLREAHLLKGFVRFADVGGALVATISPKNDVLPYIAEHFIRRYEDENFMIYDKTHKAALICENKKASILRVERVDFPEITAGEAKYQALWKKFYDTIAIEGRENPRCRMTHMPKRFWENMLEVKDLVGPKR